MGVTNFPNGVSSFGVPVYGGLPAIKGTYYFVDPQYGSNSNRGTTAKRAFKDLSTAYADCTSGVGDGIVLISSGTGTSSQTTSYLSAALDWTKYGITVVGMCAPVAFSQRARIANTTTVLNLAYMIDVQGHNNQFYNLQIGNWGSDAAAVGGLIVSGDRNYFRNVHAVGAGHATPANVATANSLTLSGDENTFEDCVFGIDTIDSKGDKANGVIVLSGGGARNMFRRCLTLSMTSSTNTARGAVKFGGAGDAITRHVYFIDCLFCNYEEGDIESTPPAEVFIGTNPNNGHAILHNCSAHGFTAIDAASGSVSINMVAPATDGTGGIGKSRAS